MNNSELVPQCKCVVCLAIPDSFERKCFCKSVIPNNNLCYNSAQGAQTIITLYKNKDKVLRIVTAYKLLTDLKFSSNILVVKSTCYDNFPEELIISHINDLVKYISVLDPDEKDFCCDILSLIDSLFYAKELYPLLEDRSTTFY